MNLFDLIILAVLVLLTLRGGKKGMISQIVSVGSYFVCWIVASRFAFAVAPSIPAHEPWNRIGAMLVLFVGTMIAVRLLHRRLEKAIESWHLKEFNRQMGALLGFLKGVLICMVITFFAVMLSEASRQSVFASASGKYIVRLITKTGAFIPEDTCKLLKAQIALFDAEVNGSAPQSVEVAGPASPLDLLAQGATLVDDANQLREDLDKKSNNAASLLDALKKWWNGDSTNSTTETQIAQLEPEKKIESADLPESPVFTKQPILLQPPPTVESVKSPPQVLTNPSVLPSDELLIRHLGLSSGATPETFSTPPLSSPKGSFVKRLASEGTSRSPDRLLNMTKEAPSPKAAALFSPQQRQSLTQWDPKTWAQSLEDAKTR